MRIGRSGSVRRRRRRRRRGRLGVKVVTEPCEAVVGYVPRTPPVDVDELGFERASHRRVGSSCGRQVSSCRHDRWSSRLSTGGCPDAFDSTINVSCPKLPDPRSSNDPSRATIVSQKQHLGTFHHRSVLGAKRSTEWNSIKQLLGSRAVRGDA